MDSRSDILVTLCSNLRAKLYKESYEFVRQQRIQCLMQGAWFVNAIPLQSLVPRDHTRRSPRPWRFMRLVTSFLPSATPSVTNFLNRTMGSNIYIMLIAPSSSLFVMAWKIYRNESKSLSSVKLPQGSVLLRQTCYVTKAICHLLRL